MSASKLRFFSVNRVCSFVFVYNIASPIKFTIIDFKNLTLHVRDKALKLNVHVFLTDIDRKKN